MTAAANDLTEKEMLLLAANNLDCELKKLVVAAVAQGVKRTTVLNLLLTHAYEVMSGEPNSGRTGPETVELVVAEAVSLRAMFV